MTPIVTRWMRKQQLDVKAEFSLPWGISDLVGVSLNRDRVNARLGLRQTRAIGPAIRVELLRNIPDVSTGRSISIRKLQVEYCANLPNAAIESEVDRLIKDRFVVRIRRGGFQKLNGWVPLHDRIVAVELKLVRVADALAQAACNRAFATESYVALPLETAKNLMDGRRAELFRNVGVGVLGVSGKRCELLLRPGATPAPIDETLQMHCVERFWRTKGSSA